MSYKINIGAVQQSFANGEYGINIGAYMETEGVVELVTGTSAGASGGSGVLSRTRGVLGTSAGTSGGSLVWVLMHPGSGTSAGVGGGSAELARKTFIAGTASASGGGSSWIENCVLFFGVCRAEGRGASVGFIATTALSGTGAVSAAGSAVLDVVHSLSYITNDSNYRIELEYDPVKLGILITRTNTQDLTNDNVWYDIRTKGFYPEVYQKDLRSYSTLYYHHASSGYRGMLIGGSDGYIHLFDQDSKNDYGLNVDESIDSYIWTPPVKLNEEDKEGKMTSLITYLGGKSLGSNAPASNGISFEVYVADSIEECYEAIENGDTPSATGSVTSAGRSVRQRTKCRGAYAVVKMYNNNVSETWALNKVVATILPAGRIR